MSDDVERTLVFEGWPHSAEEPRNGLKIVGEYLWPRFEYLCEQGGVAAEVRNENLNAGVWIEFVYCSNCLGIQPSAFVFEIIARHTSDSRITQLHSAN